MKHTKKKLKNGLRYLFVPMKQKESVLVMVLVGTGADFESKAENGLSHFLEHMCFKGTANRPSSKQIALEFENIGAQNNAFTDRGITGYHARAHKKHASKIFDILADIYLNSTFPEEEMAKEKGVVIQEINMYMDDPQYRVGKLSSEQIFGDQPMGREIIGTKENITGFTKKDLINYHAKHYAAKNTLVVVAGNFNEKYFEKEIAKTFGKMKPGKPMAYPKTLVAQKAPHVAIEHKKTDQTHLILSFHAFNYFDKRIGAAKSLSAAFGGGMSSRLFSKMREELGICYYVRSRVEASNNIGLFSIYAGVANERLEEALKAIVEEIKKVKKEGITEAELKKVTEGRLSGLVLNLETSEDYAYLFATDELLKKKISSIADHERRIQAVKLKDAHAAAKHIFNKKGANLAVIGPFNEAHRKRLLRIISEI